MSGRTFCLSVGLSLLVTAMAAWATEDQIIIDPNLVGWWPFEEGQGDLAVDQSGHANHGTLVGDPQWVPGHDGLALDFDGQGDYIDTGKMASELRVDGNSPRTIALWVYPRSFNGGGLYELGGDGTREGFSLRARDSDGGWQARYGGVDANVFAGESRNEWVHLTHVYEASKAEVYVNGYYPRSRRQLVLDTTDDKPFRIGICEGITFDGLIDDVRLYDRAMTRQEIQRIMYGSPLLAAEPRPDDDAATDIARASVLSWSGGAIAIGHDLYFGTDEAQVRDATPQTEGIYRGRLPAGQTSYELPEAPPDWNAAYCWRVDEINVDGTVTAGKVWRFTTVNHLIIDDFESYNDDLEEGNWIWDTWLDGWIIGNGSTVGYMEAPFARMPDPVHGGRQSMPFSYYNIEEPWYSEAVRTWEPPQDWVRYGVDALTLHFVGWPVTFFERTDGRIAVGGKGKIGGMEDAFNYVWKPLPGDGSIVVRIDSVADVDPNAMAGVMIRWNLWPDSKNVALLMTPSHGTAFQYRIEDGGPTEQIMQPGPMPPYWLKLSREGRMITAQCSPDGVNWGPVTDRPEGSSLEMSVGEAFIGLAVTTPSWRATSAEFSGVSVTGSEVENWEIEDIASYYRGNDPEPMYVALVDAMGRHKTVYHPDPLAVGAATWQRWDIPLSEYASAGLDVTAIQQMIVGVADRDNPIPAGEGIIYFDDFWLTRSDAP